LTPAEPDERSPSVVIVGGGYAGTSAALHLAKYARRPLSITIIEPRETLGCGLAYSANDPDHRINGPHRILMIEAGDTERFPRWTESRGIDRDDHDGWARPNELYVRRQIFGCFMAEELQAAQRANRSGSIIVHCRSPATGARRAAPGSLVRLSSGEELRADLVIVATGNELPARPTSLAAELDSDPRYVANPWDWITLARFRSTRGF
jgi:uncharacterized NAD(P)/FAD-binding protein YdhS